MTPEQRKAFHDTIDQAISLGAAVTVNVHPSHFDDEAPIRRLLMVHSTDRDRQAGEQWVTFEFGSWRNTVTMFDAHDTTPRPRPAAPNGAPISTPYVHADDAGMFR